MLYTRNAIMQAGYQYDREASAKARKTLKTASKNKKMDSILYGADIKAESVFSGLTQGPQPPAPPTAPAAPGAPPISIPSTTTPSTTTPSTTTSVVPTPATSSISGLRALAPPRVNIQPVLPPAAVSTPLPGSSRRPTPLETGTLVSVEDIAPLTLTQRAAAVVAPTIKNVGQVLESYARSPTSLSPVATTEQTTISPISTAQAPAGELTEPPLQERYYEQLIPAGKVPEYPRPRSPTSQAPTVSSSVHGGERDEDLDVPPLETNLHEDSDIQLLSSELFGLLGPIQVDSGKAKPQNQNTITAVKTDGSIASYRIAVVNSDRHYRFDAKRGKTSKSLRVFPNEYDIDVKASLERAIQRTKNNHYNPNPGKGETTGIGIGSDEANIRSPNVVFRSNKLGKTVPKGKLYLMEPQLYRGHIRLYSKSGRPVVTRSNVSPSFQRLAKDIVERNTFEADDYSGLEPKETADANYFIKMTKPIQPRNIDRLSNADTIYQLKKRYEVLVGELSAGNTGKVVLTEMEEILRKLIRMHAMNEKKGSQLIRNLRAF